MTLNIGSSLSGGLRRVANRNGLVLLVAYLGLGVVWQVTFYSAFLTLLQRSGVSTAEFTLPSVGAPFPVAVGGAVLSLALLQYLTIVAIRTFVGGHARSIPAEYYSRNISYVFVNSVVGAIVYGIAVLVGSILFLVPGIIAYVAFVFALFYVAVEDEHFVAGFRDSWHLTRGHWLRLFTLIVVVVVVVGVLSALLSAVSSLVVSAAASRGLGTLVSGVVALPFSLLTLGILAEAFTQLRDRGDNAA